MRPHTYSPISVKDEVGFFQAVKASTDWTIKESVKAKLKVIVKRTLRHYGYPPDMQKLATDLVLRQAELLAGEFSGVETA